MRPAGIGQLDQTILRYRKTEPLSHKWFFVNVKHSRSVLLLAASEMFVAIGVKRRKLDGARVKYSSRAVSWCMLCS